LIPNVTIPTFETIYTWIPGLKKEENPRKGFLRKTNHELLTSMSSHYIIELIKNLLHKI
jgi:hypothetical protein